MLTRISARAFFVLLCCAFAPLANADFVVGNLVVYRVGDGSGTLTDASAAVFLDEYTIGGVATGTSVAMPTAAGGGNNPLTASGTDMNEGLLTLSVDGTRLVVPGYATGTGTASVGSTNTSAVPRVVGLVTSDETVNTGTTTTNFDGDAIRSAAFDPDINAGAGGTIWITGSEGGVVGTEPGSTDAGTQVATSPGALFQVNVFNGQLYTSEDTGGGRVRQVGSGEPFGSGNSNDALQMMPASDSIGFFFADLDSGISGVDTLYVANSDNGISKFSLVTGGDWEARGSIDTGTDFYHGLAGSVSGTVVSLYATRNGNELVSLTDSTGYDVTISGTITSLEMASTNMAFRGVAFAPAIPEPGAVLFGCLVCAIFGVTAVIGKRPPRGDVK